VVARRDTLVAEITGQMSAMRTSARQAGFRHLLGQSISLTHLHVLTLVRSQGPLPVSELARALDVSVASATGIVSRMEERGLVARARGDEDRRVVTVALAAAGVGALDEIDGRGQVYFSGLLRTLTVGELEQLRGGLAALQRAREQMPPSQGTARPQPESGRSETRRGNPRARANVKG
jgi:DNA-binding MarR family transcriptional regulator